MHLEDMPISLCVLVDEWWQQSHPPVPRRPSRPPSLSPSEVRTLAVLAQWLRWRRSDADLSGARGVTNEKLEEKAESLKGATMPDGSKHD